MSDRVAPGHTASRSWKKEAVASNPPSMARDSHDEKQPGQQRRGGREEEEGGVMSDVKLLLLLVRRSVRS